MLVVGEVYEGLSVVWLRGATRRDVGISDVSFPKDLITNFMTTADDSRRLAGDVAKFEANMKGSVA